MTCSRGGGSIFREVALSTNLVVEGQAHVPMALRFDVTDTELHLRAYLVDSWTVYDEYTIQKT